MRDVFPTACDIAAIEPSDGLDGMSVLPVLLGRQQKAREHMYWEFYSPFQQAVRMGGWKGIRFGTEESVELYDLETDRGEQNDIAARHPQIVAGMQHIMNRSHTDSRYWPAVKKRSGRRRR